MNRILKKRVFSFVLLLITIPMISCSSSESDDFEPPIDDSIIPTNIVLTVEVVGLDSSNPNGDGSGQININISATNADKFGFRVDSDPIVENVSGVFSKTVTQTGTNSYLISAFAHSSTGNSISTFETVVVFVDNGQVQLIWSDEFDEDGSLDASKWGYDIGAGGWGNGESQYYTDRLENVVAEDGVLKIISKKENFSGSAYTSARIKTQGKFDFTYGKVEVRAKLPSTEGTWPAIWMLGADFPTVGWPACGELDIMEQTGWDKNTILATCHWQNPSDASTASYGLTTSNPTSTTAFHVYATEWTETYIKMFIDDVEYYSIDLNPSLPFDHDFFIILNVALGGSLGGTIDPNFSSGIMEIDYVRVYQ
ncbi:MAG: glycoside hydrolase family 16 protein [Flavobacteriaceae bacterium]|nr:glycoside hydrolase family 16 protein [Flavobacteriaceae bacterium]